MKEMTVKRKLKRPEILAPAGTLEKLKTAIHYGADAVYIGGNAYGLRSRAGNFTYEEMAEGVAFAKEHDAKVYVAANMVTHEGNEDGAGEFFRSLRDVGISAVIVSDPALIEICATEAPGLPIHLSTQASATNFETLEFWKEEGLERLVKFQWRKWQRFVKIRISKSKHLSMVPCVSLILVDAHCPTICRCGMQTVADVLNLVAGSMDCSICLLVKNETV
ncbi:hypothetical protein OGW_05243 [Enterococcus faecium EnGen0004]|nr:hypothetical protein OGW_05243 [Enterococcus faecium EnGen0004]